MTYWYKDECPNINELEKRFNNILVEAENRGELFRDVYDTITTRLKLAHIECVTLYLSFLKGEVDSISRCDYENIIYVHLLQIAITIFKECRYSPTAEALKLFDKSFPCEYWWERVNGVPLGRGKYEFDGIGRARIPKISHPLNLKRQRLNALTYKGEVSL